MITTGLEIGVHLSGIAFNKGPAVTVLFVVTWLKIANFSRPESTRGVMNLKYGPNPNVLSHPFRVDLVMIF